MRMMSNLGMRINNSEDGSRLDVRARSVKFVVEEFRAGIIQHEEAFSFGTVVVP